MGSEAVLLAHWWYLILGGRGTCLLRVHEPVSIEAEVGGRHHLGCRVEADRVLGGVLPSLYWKRFCEPSHLRGVQSPQRDELRRGTDLVPNTEAADLAC